MILTEDFLNADFLNELANGVKKLQSFRYNDNINMKDTISCMTQRIIMEEAGNPEFIELFGEYVPSYFKENIVYSYKAKIGRSQGVKIRVNGLEYDLTLFSSIGVNEVVDLSFNGSGFVALNYGVDVFTNKKILDINNKVKQLRTYYDYYKQTLPDSVDLADRENIIDTKINDMLKSISDSETLFENANKFDDAKLLSQVNEQLELLSQVDTDTLVSDMDTFKTNPLNSLGISTTDINMSNYITVCKMATGYKINQSIPTYSLGSVVELQHYDYDNFDTYGLVSDTLTKLSHNDVALTITAPEIKDSSGNVLYPKKQMVLKYVASDGSTPLYVGGNADAIGTKGGSFTRPPLQYIDVPITYAHRNLADMESYTATVIDVNFTKERVFLHNNQAGAFPVAVTNEDFIIPPSTKALIMRDKDNNYVYLGSPSSIVPTMSLNLSQDLGDGAHITLTPTSSDMFRLLSGIAFTSINVNGNDSTNFTVVEDTNVDAKSISVSKNGSTYTISLNPNSFYFLGKQLDTIRERYITTSQMRTALNESVGDNLELTTPEIASAISYYTNTINNTSAVNMNDVTGQFDSLDSNLSKANNEVASNQSNVTALISKANQNLSDLEKLVTKQSDTVDKYQEMMNAVEGVQSARILLNDGDISNITKTSVTYSEANKTFTIPQNTDVTKEYLAFIDTSGHTYAFDEKIYKLVVSKGGTYDIILPKQTLGLNNMTFHKILINNKETFFYFGDHTNLAKVEFLWSGLIERLMGLNQQVNNIYDNGIFPSGDMTFPVDGVENPVISYHFTDTGKPDTSKYVVVDDFQKAIDGNPKLTVTSSDLVVAKNIKNIDGSNMLINLDGNDVTVEIKIMNDVGVDYEKANDSSYPDLYISSTKYYALNIQDNLILVGRPIDNLMNITPQYNDAFVLDDLDNLSKSDAESKNVLLTDISKVDEKDFHKLGSLRMSDGSIVPQDINSVNIKHFELDADALGLRLFDITNDKVCIEGTPTFDGVEAYIPAHFEFQVTDGYGSNVYGTYPMKPDGTFDFNNKLHFPSYQDQSFPLGFYTNTNHGERVLITSNISFTIEGTPNSNFDIIKLNKDVIIRDTVIHRNSDDKSYTFKEHVLNKDIYYIIGYDTVTNVAYIHDVVKPFLSSKLYMTINGERKYTYNDLSARLPKWNSNTTVEKFLLMSHLNILSSNLRYTMNVLDSVYGRIVESMLHKVVYTDIGLAKGIHAWMDSVTNKRNIMVSRNADLANMGDAVDAYNKEVADNRTRISKDTLDPIVQKFIDELGDIPIITNEYTDWFTHMVSCMDLYTYLNTFVPQGPYYKSFETSYHGEPSYEYVNSSDDGENTLYYSYDGFSRVYNK